MNKSYFTFPNLQNLTLQPNESIVFQARGNSRLAYVGTSSDSQIEINGNALVSNLWNGKTILFTANCTITVPATLIAQLGFVFRTLAGVTVTWAITSPFTWETTPTTTPEKTTGSFMRRGSTNTILLDF